MTGGTEYIDVISPDGNLTGVSKSRNEIHQEGIWHRSVHIWVLNDKEELLIQQRSLEKESHPGLWDASCAGHIPSGDSSLQTAARELKEELGLNVRPEELERIFTIESHFVLNNGTYKENELVDVYLLRKNINVHLFCLMILLLSLTRRSIKTFLITLTNLFENYIELSFLDDL